MMKSGSRQTARALACRVQLCRQPRYPRPLFRDRRLCVPIFRWVCQTSADESAPAGAVDPAIFASILTLLLRLPNDAAAFRLT